MVADYSVMTLEGRTTFSKFVYELSELAVGLQLIKTGDLFLAIFQEIKICNIDT